MDPESPNFDLINELNSIAEYYKLEGDVHRMNAYSNAAGSLNALNQTVTSGQEAKELIKLGIGVSIAHDIDEFINTGKITRLEQLKLGHPERSIIDLFSRIHGVSAITANKFYDLGYRTVEDLWNSDKLTESQRMSIIYMRQLEEKIQRLEMDIIKNILKNELSGITFEIVGSYRRGSPLSSDIDILIKKENEINMENVISRINRYLVGKFAQGETRFIGIFHIEGFNAHQIDITLIPSEEWWTALMHSTGSKRFNILMRQRAKDLNMRLNEHGLYYYIQTSTEEQVLQRYSEDSEEEIFALLNVKYLKPEERTNDLLSLILIE